MGAKLEFIRQGLSGPIWGLINDNGLLVRQFPCQTGGEALDFFISQSKSLVEDDGISNIEFEGRIINL